MGAAWKGTPDMDGLARRVTTKFERTRSLLFTLVDGDHLTVDIQAGYCYSLNDTSHRVWELLVQPRTFGSLCAALAEEFQVAPATCQRDVSVLLGSWQAEGLVRVTDG